MLKYVYVDDNISNFTALQNDVFKKDKNKLLFVYLKHTLRELLSIFVDFLFTTKRKSSQSYQCLVHHSCITLNYVLNLLYLIPESEQKVSLLSILALQCIFSDNLTTDVTLYLNQTMFFL